MRNCPRVTISRISTLPCQRMQPLSSSQQQDGSDSGPDRDPVGQRERECAEDIGVEVENEHDNSDSRFAIIAASDHVFGVEDSEPSPKDDKAAGEWNKMDWIEKIKRASAQREQRECADYPPAGFH